MKISKNHIAIPMKRKIIILLAFTILAGCSTQPFGQEEVSIQQDSSHVAYVKELNLLAPKVCLKHKSDTIGTDKTYIVNFELTKPLDSFVTKGADWSVDSRDLYSAQKSFGQSPPEDGVICTGKNMELKETVIQNQLQELIIDNNLEVVITDLDGKVLTSAPITEFVLGQPDGSVIKP